jgi:hypothetical protein
MKMIQNGGQNRSNSNFKGKNVKKFDTAEELFEDLGI